MKKPEYRSVYLYLTQKCNAGCTFCYRKGLFERNSPKDLGPMMMSREMADNILKFCFLKIDSVEDLLVYFWGGEPTMNYDVMNYVMTKFPQLQYHTNTNGALIDEKMYKFFSANRNFGITWSLGNAYEKYGSIQKKVESEVWCRKLISEYEQNNVNFMVVNYDNLADDYEWIRNNITKKITIDLATRFDHKSADLERFAEQYLALMLRYKDDPEALGTLDPAVTSNIYSKEWGYKAQKQSFRYCKSGLERLFIDMNGGIWQCDNMYICQHNKLGDIETGIDYSKLDLARKIEENREEYLGRYCQDCELYKMCPRNKCLGLNLEHTGDMFKPEPAFCKMNKVLYNVTKKYMAIKDKESK